MSKWKIPVAVATAVVALAMFWPTNGAVPPAPTPAQTTVQVETPTPEQTYLVFVRDLGFTGTDSELVDLGKGVCSVLDEYGADTTLLALAKPDNVTVDQYAGILVASVTTYCPRHEEELLG